MPIPILSKNELKTKPERDVVMIYSKATMEAGNVGLTGALFTRKVKKAMPTRVAVQGAGYFWLTSGLSLIFKCGSERATRNMIKHIHDAINLSPDKKIVLAGIINPTVESFE